MLPRLLAQYHLALGLGRPLVPSLESSPPGAPIGALGVVALLRLPVDPLGVGVVDGDPVHAGERVYALALLGGIWGMRPHEPHRSWRT